MDWSAWRIVTLPFFKKLKTMNQVVIKKGGPVVIDVPSPHATPGFVLVQVKASCVSPGTEMAGMVASGQSLLQRVLKRPDKLKLVWEQMRTKGVSSVVNKAKQTLDKELLCGYSAAGEVIDMGVGVDGFHRGMRVAVAGAGHANHAEFVAVPANLVVAMPDEIDFAQASTVALGGIAMQGVRRAEVSLGERVVVIGCGAIGMLAVQMLKAAGCRVLATDLDESRLAMARELGAEASVNPTSEDAVSYVMHWSEGKGVDAALVFAATSSSEPVSQAFQMSRRKGRVVLVGVAGNEYKRADMYQKELDFVISTSYGPGRYDDSYELDGQDYPYGYVRWTENRNMKSYLDLMAMGQINVDPLIGVKELMENAPAAYQKLKAPERPMLAVLECADEEIDGGDDATVAAPTAEWKAPESGRPLQIAMVGAGSFVQAMHVPILLGLGNKVAVPWSCSRTGASARTSAALFPKCRASVDYDEVLADPAVHAVLIGTRHNTHGDLAIRALKAGKGVFVEKPMCLTHDEYIELSHQIEQCQAPFMVGYNRRFSPFAQKIKSVVENRIHPLMIQYTMNAGFLPSDHWTQTQEGGGRLMGEACHIVDLFRSLVGSPVKSMSCNPLRSKNAAALPTDNFSLTLNYEDGSVATLLYTAMGHRGMAKEVMQVFVDEKVFVNNDYLTMDVHGMPNASMSLKTQDKGHAKELEAFHQASVSDERFPIPWDELKETWEVCYQADQLCRVGED